MRGGKRTAAGRLGKLNAMHDAPIYMKTRRIVFGGITIDNRSSRYSSQAASRCPPSAFTPRWIALKFGYLLLQPRDRK